MKTARLIRQSLRMMTRARLRSSFMMLGSLVGVAALTFVISIGEAANRKMLVTVDQIFGKSSFSSSPAAAGRWADRAARRRG